jgi:hypothetical protein
MNPAIDDELDGEAPAPSPTRRDGRIIAMPAEPIPAEVNDAFLEDLAFERALSAARGLALGLSGSTEPPRGGLQAVWGQSPHPKPSQPSWLDLGPAFNPNPRQRMNASTIEATPIATLKLNRAPDRRHHLKRDSQHDPPLRYFTRSIATDPA